jgi:hypothetical protein
MFKVNDNSGTGFHIVFGNGWTASVQWGSYNYADGQTAEIAAWDKDGNWHSFGHDQVKGWCSPEEVATFLQMVSSF